MDFVAIDFETASYSRDSACALAVVKVVNNCITERHSWLFQPPRNEYAPQCVNVHGITPDMTEHIGGIETIHNRIMELLDGATVVAHSAAFDTDVLRASLVSAGLPVPKLAEVFCTCELSDRKTLEACCSEWNIQLDHHDPLSDAVACAKLFLCLQGKPIAPKTRTTTTGWGDTKRKVKHDTLMPPDLSAIENKDTIFFGKRVVITGVLEQYPEREVLASILKGYGADISTSISSKTNLVICGDGAGPAKMMKIEEINRKGGDIRVIDEDELYDLMAEIEQMIIDKSN